MTTKSDFTQKLLHDLRLRKERMGASSSQHSSNGSSSTRGSNGNIVAAKGSPHTKTCEYLGLTSGNSSNRQNNKTKSFQIEEASNHQLVRYTSSGQTGDLSRAMELAFSNGVKLKKTSTKSGIPMLNFLQDIGKRTLGSGNIEIKSSFGKNSSSSDSHIITFSQVHINEISKGIQKLNRILKNCSKGINLDSYSKNVGNELWKGSVDLEQSLRMLANLNEASDYITKARGKNTIKLVEDDDDDGNENSRSKDLNQVERPRFSFDKPNNKNSIHTKQGAKKIIKQQSLALNYPEETQRCQEKPLIHSRSISMDLDEENERISQRKNPRTSNVIAKLMGLDDLPLKNDLKEIINSKSIETMASKRELTFHDNQQEIKIIQIGEDHGNKITMQETEKEDNDKEEKETNIIKTNKIECPPLLQEKIHHKMLLEPGASKTKHVSESKHEKPRNSKSLTREPRASQQERLDKSKIKSCLRVSEKKQACKKLDTSGKKTLEKHLEGNRPKITFNTRHGETDEMKISKRRIHRKTDAVVNRNRIVSKPEPHFVVSEPLEKQNDKNTRISGLAKQESNPHITESISNQTRTSKLIEDITRYNHNEEKKQSPFYSSPQTANGNIIKIEEETHEVTNESNPSQQPSLCAVDIGMELQKSSLSQSQHKGDSEIKEVSIHIVENEQTRHSPSWLDDQLTKSEKKLKEILIKGQLFLHTAEALFKFNIPATVLHGADHNDYIAETKLILDCVIELLKKKGKRRELGCYPSTITLDCAIMFKSFDELIKQLNKDLCQLKSYGGKWGEEYFDPAENIYQMLENDVHNKDPDMNSMWDFDWYEKTFAACEKDELIKDVEKHMLRKLLEELTRDLLDTKYAL